MIRSLYLMVFAIFASAPALAESDVNFAHIVTSGFGELSVTPDSASFVAQVERTTMNAEQAKQSVDDVVSEFLASLQEEGVTKDAISSSNLYLAPQYFYPKDEKPELVGYKATRRLSVQVVNLEKLNDLLDAAIKHGVDRIDNIQLTVSDKNRYVQQARELAIRDAKEKAQSLAKGFDRELGDVWKIEYRNSSVQPVVAKVMSLEKQARSNSYQDANITIRDSVDVIYKLK